MAMAFPLAAVVCLLCGSLPLARAMSHRSLSALYAINQPTLTETSFPNDSSGRPSIEITVEHAALGVSGVSGPEVIEYRLGMCADPGDNRFGTLENQDTVTTTSTPTADLAQKTVILNPLTILNGITPTIVTATSPNTVIEYCMRFSMETASGDIANTREIDITFTGTLAGSTGVSGLASAVPMDPPEGTLGDTFSVTSSTVVTEVSRNVPVEITIAMAAGDYPSASIIGVETFQFTSGTILQNAYSGGVIQDLSSKSTTAPCEGGVESCKFSTIFKADFFESAVTITGSGVVQLQIGTRRRRVLLSTGTVTTHGLTLQVRRDDDGDSCDGLSILRLVFCWLSSFLRSIFSFDFVDDLLDSLGF